jgi:hypothetical protein
VKIRIVLYISLLFLLVAGSAAAQSTGYRVSGLTSNRPGASHQSATLLNPWGLAFLPGSPSFCIAENASGRVDSYDATGALLGGVVIPAPPITGTLTQRNCTDSGDLDRSSKSADVSRESCPASDALAAKCRQVQSAERQVDREAPQWEQQ